MIKFRYRYFIFTVIIFLIELYIAAFVHDEIIRPYIGDLLVVILIYCLLRSFLNTSVRPIAISTLLFSYTIEILQYLNIVEVLGFKDSKLARILIGTNFSWIDILLYTTGIALVLLIEKMINNKNSHIISRSK